MSGLLQVFFPIPTVHTHRGTCEGRLMAQPSAAVLSAIIEGGNGILQTKYLYLATYAITIYDHLLTLDLEVEYIWKRKLCVVQPTSHSTIFSDSLLFSAC